MHARRLHPQRPILITEARVSGDEEFDQRRRRYLVMMALRAICIVAAAAVIGISGWLSAFFVLGALVLPWTAVLIANDRPPKRALRFRRFVPGHGADGRELTTGRPDDGTGDPHRVIEG